MSVAQDTYGDTALHDACKFGHFEVAKTLVKAGTDVSLKNKLGKDAATLAAEHGYTAIAEMIRGGRSKL